MASIVKTEDPGQWLCHEERKLQSQRDRESNFNFSFQRRYMRGLKYFRGEIVFFKFYEVSNLRDIGLNKWMIFPCAFNFGENRHITPIFKHICYLACFQTYQQTNISSLLDSSSLQQLESWKLDFHVLASENRVLKTRVPQNKTKRTKFTNNFSFSHVSFRFHSHL